MVVVALTVVAGVGASAVYFAAQAQHRRDRRDISAWEARALPAARDGQTMVGTLRPSMPVSQIVTIRSALERDLVAITRSPLPEIVRPAADLYIEAFRRSESALEAVGTASFRTAMARALAAFARAATAVHDLDCRARMPACASP